MPNSTAQLLAEHQQRLEEIVGALVQAHDVFVAQQALDREYRAAFAELRAELRALSNRVEALTRAIARDTGERAVSVLRPTSERTRP